jgi:hypothetical protein
VATPSAVPLATTPTPDNSQLLELAKSLNLQSQLQSARFDTLIGEIRNLNECITNVMKLLTREPLDVSTTIPSIQPVAKDSDLKNVYLHIESTQNDESVDESTPNDESVIDTLDSPDIDEQVDTPNIEEEEVDLEDDAEVMEIEKDDEEEGIEVEEWTYKGRTFFKDSENTVYANNDGEIGDSIGTYDPVKNIVKKLASS